MDKKAPLAPLPLRLGLTMWSNPHWQHSLYGSNTSAAERLNRYARTFHTVEGNTTFYATPSARSVANWCAATDDDFRFTFKLPSVITHKQQLSGCGALLNEFIQVMAPLHARTGQWIIQLPASFGPEFLPRLQAFCRQFPARFPLGVEVRHPAFFAKGDAEKRLNHWLLEQQIDRIIMDSRPLFAAAPDNETIREAQRKKPQVPVHAITTADHPMIRFIGQQDTIQNERFFTPWLAKLPEWIAQGKQPYLMIHTPDNHEAPQLAFTLYQHLREKIALPPLAMPQVETGPGPQLSLL